MNFCSLPLGVPSKRFIHTPQTERKTGGFNWKMAVFVLCVPCGEGSWFGRLAIFWKRSDGGVSSVDLMKLGNRARQPRPSQPPCWPGLAGPNRSVSRSEDAELSVRVCRTLAFLFDIVNAVGCFSHHIQRRKKKEKKEERRTRKHKKRRKDIPRRRTSNQFGQQKNWVGCRVGILFVWRRCWQVVCWRSPDFAWLSDHPPFLLLFVSSTGLLKFHQRKNGEKKKGETKCRGLLSLLASVAYWSVRMFLLTIRFNVTLRLSFLDPNWIVSLSFFVVVSHLKIFAILQCMMSTFSECGWGAPAIDLPP